MLEKGQYKICVVLCNLGGPSSLKDIPYFLFRMFTDKRILKYPFIIRVLIALIIVFFRMQKAKKIYKNIGGCSPILKNTNNQASKLENIFLNKNKYKNYALKVFSCMRYSTPMSASVLEDVSNYHPNLLIILPLYPHFSFTTTQSSFDAWEQACYKKNCRFLTKIVHHFYSHKLYIECISSLILDEILTLSETQIKNSRILFSAHGLPKKYISAGDPYQQHIQQCAHLVMSNIKKQTKRSWDWDICYQSRLGPAQWTQPFIDDALQKAKRDGVGVIIVPISFVSENSETLVELDIDYKKKAHAEKILFYKRVKTCSTHPLFIQLLEELVKEQTFL